MSTWMQGQVEAQAEKCSLKVNIVRPKHCVMSKTINCIACKRARFTSYKLQSLTWYYISEQQLAHWIIS